MRRLNARLVLTLLALVTAPGSFRPAAAGEEAGASTATLGFSSDPCRFYRGQAYGRGLDHFLTEMLWACEAIVMRRVAGSPLSEHLVAAEQALDRYRIALIAAGAAEFVRGQSARRGALRFGAADHVKSSLAASTGTLAALEAIRSGY